MTFESTILDFAKLIARDLERGKSSRHAMEVAGMLAGSGVLPDVVACLISEASKKRRADGITGFVTTSAIALKGLGLPPAQQRVMMYADHGLDLYGSALLTTRAWAEANGDALRRTVAALMRGFRAQVADPAEAMAILKRVEPLTDVPLEMERHAPVAERIGHAE